MKTLLILVLISIGCFFGYKQFYEQPEQPTPEPATVATVESTPPPSKIEFKEVRDLRTWNKTQSGGIEPTLDTSRSVPANRNPAYRSEPTSKQSAGN